MAVGTVDNIVAYGTAFFKDPPGQLCHGYPLGDANVRVSIDHAKEEKAAVPYPTEDIKTVKQAMGSIISWPKELVIRLAPASPVTVRTLLCSLIGIYSFMFRLVGLNITKP